MAFGPSKAFNNMRGYKYKLIPNTGQERTLRRWNRSLKKVYNMAFERSEAQYNARKIILKDNPDYEQELKAAKMRDVLDKIERRNKKLPRRKKGEKTHAQQVKKTIRKTDEEFLAEIEALLIVARAENNVEEIARLEEAQGWVPLKNLALRPSSGDLKRLLTLDRAQYEWIRDLPMAPSQKMIDNLEVAYKNHYVYGADRPEPKISRDRVGIHFPDPNRVKLNLVAGTIEFPRSAVSKKRGDPSLKMKFMHVRRKDKRSGRFIEDPNRSVITAADIGNIRNYTITWDGLDWWVSLMVGNNDPAPKHAGGEIGVDLGVVQHMSLSDGSFIAPIRAYRDNELKLARLQRRQSFRSGSKKITVDGKERRTRPSKRYIKLARKINKLHKRIANIRASAIHEATARLTDNYAFIGVEELGIKEMTKRRPKSPGKRISKQERTGIELRRLRASTPKNILDQGWGMAVVQLEYKAARKGGETIKVDPAYTSQLCSECGYVAEENRLKQAVFRCVKCGYEENADTNASRNILRAAKELAPEVRGIRTAAKEKAFADAASNAAKRAARKAEREAKANLVETPTEEISTTPLTPTS